MADEAPAVDVPVVPPVAEQTPSAQEPVETASPDSPSVSEETETPEQERTYTQKELDDAAAKIRAKAERKAQREADRRIAELLQQIKQPEVAAPDPAGKPQIENYQTLQEYETALDEWADKRAEAKIKEQEAKAAEAKRREEMSKVAASYQEREEDARDKYSDFDQVAYRTPYDCSQAMADAIQFSESGPDLAYYFGKNPAEANRIAALPPILAIKEIGKLEIKISQTPPAVKTSSAPEPITPVKPKGSSPPRSSLDPNFLKEHGIDAWMRAEEARMRKKAESR